MFIKMLKNSNIFQKLKIGNLFSKNGIENKFSVTRQQYVEPTDAKKKTLADIINHFLTNHLRIILNISVILYKISLNWQQKNLNAV